MKKIIILLFISLCALLCYAETPKWLWASKAGGTNDFDIGYDIVTDNNGNNYITGCFYGTAYFDSFSITSSGWDDIFVAKMDANGKWLWVKKAGGPSQDRGIGIDIDNEGNIVIVGYFFETAYFDSFSITSSGSSDTFVAKIDANGNWLWVNRAGGSFHDKINAIITDDANNSYVTGFFSETAIFGSTSLTSSGGWDIFVAKIDPNGDWLWATKAGSSDHEEGYGITIDASANCFVTGFFQDTINFNSYSLVSSGGTDIFVAKIDSDGIWQWASKAGGFDSDRGKSINIDNDGNTYVTGIFSETAIFGTTSLICSGDYDIFVAKIDTNGNWQWASKAGGSDVDYVNSIIVDNLCNSYIVGYFNLSATFDSHTLISNGEKEIFIAKIDSDGNWFWAVNVGGSQNDNGMSLSFDVEQNVYLTGFFEDVVHFGSHNITSNGDYDIFVAKLEKDFVAKFSCNKNFGNSSLEVNFIDESQIAPNGWNWDFQNDGIIDSNDQNPSFTYNQSGTYDVKLIVERNTILDTLIKENYIVVQESELQAPQNAIISKSGSDIILNWDLVTNADYYLIYSANQPDGDFIFLSYTSDLTFTHTNTLIETDKLFYIIIGFDGTMSDLATYIQNNHRRSFKADVK